MTSIGQSIEALVSEQGIDRDLVIDAMKEAVKAAARKQFKAQDKKVEDFGLDTSKEKFGKVEQLVGEINTTITGLKNTVH